MGAPAALVKEEDEARFFISEVINAVNHCHQNTVAHRWWPTGQSWHVVHWGRGLLSVRREGGERVLDGGGVSGWSHTKTLHHNLKRLRPCGTLQGLEDGQHEQHDAVKPSIVHNPKALIAAQPDLTRALSLGVPGLNCRDLKMDNTLLDDLDPPRIKLCDFGFAKWWTDRPCMNTITGVEGLQSGVCVCVFVLAESC